MTLPLARTRPVRRERAKQQQQQQQTTTNRKSTKSGKAYASFARVTPEKQHRFFSATLFAQTAKRSERNSNSSTPADQTRHPFPNHPSDLTSSSTQTSFAKSSKNAATAVHAPSRDGPQSLSGLSSMTKRSSQPSSSSSSHKSTTNSQNQRASSFCRSIS